MVKTPPDELYEKMRVKYDLPRDPNAELLGVKPIKLHEAKKRFDVHYAEHRAYVDYHFCREWDEDGGCYGTNLLHGFTWEEAREHVSAWYRAQAEYWETLKEEEWDGGDASCRV